MKKSILAAGISLLLVFPGAAAEPTTLNGRMERVEDVLYGETRSGSLTERITSADNLIYGTGSSTGVGLDDRVGNLYADVVNSGNDAAPSISSRTNALEYYLTDEIKREPLAGRIGDMEKSVFGSVKSGALDKRTAELEKAIYGDQHSEMKDVVLPEKTVFKISLNDSVRISKNPLKYGGSGIPLKAGQMFVLEDLIKASAVYSANNATYAIAEYVGNGSVFSFVAKMNKKLKEYGLQNEIKYHTPAGLPTRVTKQPMDEGTARGIYKLSIEALKYKKYIEIAGIKSTKIYNGKISIRNRNHLIGENGVYGIKTGFHKEAKYNIAVASKFEGTDVIIVVMGGETYKTRDGIVLSVLDILNNNYTVKNGLIKRK